MTFRWQIWALGLISFLVMFLLYATGHDAAYNAIFREWGVVTGFPKYQPFIDLQGALSGVECHRRGIDVFMQNPCDALGRVYLYSPLLLHLSVLGIDGAWTARVGSILAVIFLTVFAAIAKASNSVEKMIYVAILFSQSSAMAVERGNLDILLFSIICVSCFFAQSRGFRGYITYAAIFLCALIKFYPIVALSLAIKDRLVRLVIVAFAASALWAVFFYAYRHDLAELWPHAQQTEPLLDAFGSANLRLVWQHLSTRLPPAAAVQMIILGYVVYALTIATIVAVSFSTARKLSPFWQTQSLPKFETALFSVGGLLVLFAFFSTQNPPYRAIWLFLLIPLLLHLRTVRNSPTVIRSATLMVGAVVILSWFEAIRLACLRIEGGSVLADMLTLFMREPLWWVLATAIMTVLWLELLNAPTVRQLLAFRSNHPGSSPSPSQ